MKHVLYFLLGLLAVPFFVAILMLWLLARVVTVSAIGVFGVFEIVGITSADYLIVFGQAASKRWGAFVRWWKRPIFGGRT